MEYLRATAAQLLLVTATAASVAHLRDRSDHRPPRVPAALRWAPALLGPVAAVAQLQHARRPSHRTDLAVRILDASSFAAGTALFCYDALGSDADRPPASSALAFASAGLLGVVLERQERQIRRSEDDLRRRARIVERLLPERKPRFARLVIHV